MSIAHNKIAFQPDDPAPDPPDPTPIDPLTRAESLLSKFHAGGWFLTRSATGSTADNRAALMAGIEVAKLRQAKAQHVEIVAVLSRIAAALEADHDPFL